MKYDETADRDRLRSEGKTLEITPVLYTPEGTLLSLPPVALVLLAAGIATVLIMADSGPGPDGSPAHPYPSVTPYPGGWEPK